MILYWIFFFKIFFRKKKIPKKKSFKNNFWKKGDLDFGCPGVIFCRGHETQPPFHRPTATKLKWAIAHPAHLAPTPLLKYLYWPWLWVSRRHLLQRPWKTQPPFHRQTAPRMGRCNHRPGALWSYSSPPRPWTGCQHLVSAWSQPVKNKKFQWKSMKKSNKNFAQWQKHGTNR